MLFNPSELLTIEFIEDQILQGYKILRLLFCFENNWFIVPGPKEHNSGVFMRLAVMKNQLVVFAQVIA